MTSQKMLEHLNDAGDDSGSDFHDGLDGWFGWNVKDGVLTITFDHHNINDTASWRLVPIGEESA